MRLPWLGEMVARGRRRYVPIKEPAEVAPAVLDSAAAARLEARFVTGELSLAEYERALERLVRPSGAPRTTPQSAGGASTGGAVRLRPADAPGAPMMRRAVAVGLVLSLGAVILGTPARRSALITLVTGQEPARAGQTAPPVPPEPPNAQPADAPQPATATVLLQDDFTDPARGVLPRASTNPARTQFGYESDGYVVRVVNAEQVRTAQVNVVGRYGDAAIAVDARLVGETPGRYVLVACRDDPARLGTHYRFLVEPARGIFSLTRWEDNRETFLVGLQPARAIRRDNAPNRLELSCAGTTIAARVNGVQVASVEDGTLTAGRLLLGTGTYAGSQLAAEARFNDLVVSAP